MLVELKPNLQSTSKRLNSIRYITDKLSPQKARLMDKPEMDFCISDVFNK